jgi:hypothetical protein
MSASLSKINKQLAYRHAHAGRLETHTCRKAWFGLCCTLLGVKHLDENDDK